MEAAKVMSDKAVGRLLVCRGKNNFTGMLTAADVVRRSEDAKLAMDYIQQVYASH
jgi:CBS domain-containing protein